MTLYLIHTPRPALQRPDIVTRILFTFSTLLAVLLTPRPAPPLVIPPWSERERHAIADAEWGAAIRAMAARTAPRFAVYR